MKKCIRIWALLLAFSSGLVAADQPSAEADFAPFAVALGFPRARTVEGVAGELTKEWTGKSKEEVQAYIRHVIRNRGKLGATKNGGRESKPDLLSLSGQSDAPGKKAMSVRVQFHYGAEGKVARVECTATP